jgi:hypothetical protein
MSLFYYRAQFTNRTRISNIPAYLLEMAGFDLSPFGITQQIYLNILDKIIVKLMFHKYNSFTNTLSPSDQISAYVPQV